MNKKRTVCLGMLCCMALSAPGNLVFGAEGKTAESYQAAAEQSLYFKNREHRFVNPLFTIKDTIYAPLQETASIFSMGITVLEDQILVADSNRVVYSYFYNDSIIYRDDIQLKKMMTPMEIDGIVYVPLEDFFTVMGYSVQAGQDGINVKDDRQPYKDWDYRFEASLFHANAGEYAVSPLGIKMVLGMAANGLQGEERQEILDIIGVKDLAALNQGIYDSTQSMKIQPGTVLQTNSALWATDQGSRQWSDALERAAKKYYGASVSSRRSPAAAAELINTWIADFTQNRITKLDTGDFQAAISSAVTFQGEWEKPFSDITKQDLNNLTGYTKEEIDTMMHVEGSYLYYEEEGVKAVTVNYKDSTVEMTFIQSDGNITNALLNRIFNYRQKKDVSLYLPAFTSKKVSDASSVLKELGLDSLFQTGKAGAYQLFRSQEESLTAYKLLQNATIKVNQKGINGAAASWLPIDEKETAGQILALPYTKPGYFCIRDTKTGEMLFIGQF